MACPSRSRWRSSLAARGWNCPPRRSCRPAAPTPRSIVDLQISQFVRLGVFGRWDKPYKTMARDYEARTLEAFYGFLQKGFVYRGLKPVYWCIHDRTTLAEAEVEYEQHTSPSIYVRYKLTSDAATIFGSSTEPGAPSSRQHLGAKVGEPPPNPIYTIIWTTTPWTLPASLAVAFHPGDGVCRPATPDATYIVAASLAAAGHRRLQSHRRARGRPFPRHRARPHHLRPSLPRPIHPRRQRHLCHRRPGNRGRPHRARPWR